MDDNGFDDVGYPDDYEADSANWGNPEWEAYEYENHVYTGCSHCGTEADELAFERWGFMGRHWVVKCPYCDGRIASGTFSLGEKVRNVWVVMVGVVQTWIARLVLWMKRTKSGGDDIPF